jgi:hypothetical protein
LRIERRSQSIVLSKQIENNLWFIDRWSECKTGKHALYWQVQNIYLQAYGCELFCRFICEGWHFTHMWEALHDCIMSLRFEAHITSLTPPHFTEVAVPHMEVSCHVFAC